MSLPASPPVSSSLRVEVLRVQEQVSAPLSPALFPAAGSEEAGAEVGSARAEGRERGMVLHTAASIVSSMISCSTRSVSNHSAFHRTLRRRRKRKRRSVGGGSAVGACARYRACLVTVSDLSTGPNAREKWHQVPLFSSTVEWKGAAQRGRERQGGGLRQVQESAGRCG